MTYELLNKKCLFSSRELTIELKLFESAVLGPPWPDFQKKSCENRRFDKKNHMFYHKNNIINK